MVWKPVVLTASSCDVDVTSETCPSDPVVEKTLEIRRVDVPTRADVKVVNDVLLLRDDDSRLLSDELGSEVGVADVIVVAEVEGVVRVVGVPFDVEVVVLEMTVEEVVVVLLSSSLDDEDGAADEDVTPVPA